MSNTNCIWGAKRDEFGLCAAGLKECKEDCPLMQEQVAATTAEVVITDAEISVSCEDPETVYADLPDGLRLIYREGKYVGWYLPGEEKADEA